MKILMLDNYDSFTYNLVHYLTVNDFVEVIVKRNDDIDLSEIEKFDKIVLSPGPGLPKEAGILLSLIERYAGRKPILGICLGHQAIAEVFGGELYNLPAVFHGVATDLKIVEPHYIFKNINPPIKVGRYHSWAVKNNLPETLIPLAYDEDGVIMALKHKTFDVVGLQFHPESVLTPCGKQMIDSWLNH